MITLWLAVAGAQEPATCPDPSTQLSTERWLHAVSLDLRGVVPELDTYDQITSDALPEALIDSWLDSDAFLERAVRHHRALLWNNVDDTDFIPASFALGRLDDIHYVRGRADDYRGDSNAHCGTDAAVFDGDGQVIPTVDVDGVLHEGWVWAIPYWDPSEPLQVCAYDAQTVETSPLGTPCDSASGATDPGCGCGPDLRWCTKSTEELAIGEAFSEDIDKRLRRVLSEGLPYTELLTGTTGYVNGPLVHFYRYQTNAPATVRLDLLPVDLDSLPDLTFEDTDTWHAIELPEAHSGVLTAPGYLLRFQTNRARADRFYNAFLCQPFQPPDGGISGLDSISQSLDLTTRSGCAYCHALLEPAASHWGRWTETGAGFLDPEGYPAFDDDCAQCSITNSDCSDVCGRYYTTDPLSSELDPFVGWLTAYQFLEDRHHDHVEQGPRKLVDQGILDGRLPTCVAENTAAWLLGRQLGEDDSALVEALSDQLVGSNWDYRALVKQIVLSDTYRRRP